MGVGVFVCSQLSSQQFKKALQRLSSENETLTQLVVQHTAQAPLRLTNTQ